MRRLIIYISLLSTAAYFSNLRLAKERTGTVDVFHSGMIKINKYLYHMSNECRQGRFDVAQNTFLDLRHHWQRQDVLVQEMATIGIHKPSYLPSDSLFKLELYINELFSADDTNLYHRLILHEIKRINGLIDAPDSTGGLRNMLLEE